MGPVNMVAIRRGLIGGWRRTAACAIGSIAGNLTLFSLALLGGHYLLSDLSSPSHQTVLEAIGVILFLPLGLYVLLLRRQGAPAGPHQNWQTLGERYRPRASGLRCRRRRRPDPRSIP